MRKTVHEQRLSQQSAKRMISLVLSIVMLFSISSVSVVANAMDVSTFNTKLASFKKEKYANNSTYKDNPSLTGGYQCFGFANEISLYIFGSYPTNSMSAASVNSGWTRTYGGGAVDNLCVGDVVRYHFHSIFITGISGNTIYYCQANVPNGTNKVTYDNSISRSSLKSKVADKLTSSGTDKTGWVAHFKNGVSSTTKAYAVGQYKVTASSGLRIRSSASTSGGQLGLIPNATKVNVTKISSNWGYTTYNKVSGWICLDYTSYIGAIPKTYAADVWVSTKGSGYQYNQAPAITSGTIGTPYYVWYKVYDKDSGALCSESNYKAKISIIYPDGKELYSTTYSNSAGNWIRVTPDAVGTYTIKVIVSGGITLNASKTFKITSNASLSYSSKEIVLNNTGTDIPTATFYLDYYNLPSSYSSFVQDFDTSKVSIEGEKISDTRLKFTVKPVKKGDIFKINCTVTLKDNKGNVIASDKCEIKSIYRNLISFYSNGGSGSMGSSAHTYDSAQQLYENKFSKQNYSFAGWSTVKDGDVVYSDKQSVTNLTSKNGATVTLYAKWTKINPSTCSHNWINSEILVKPTCSSTGTRIYTCSKCQTIKYETLAKTSHVIAEIPAVAPTCTEYGSTAGSKCVVCNTIITEPKPVQPVGHDWNSGVVTRKATETRAGVKTYTCNLCGETKTETISVIQHKHIYNTTIIEPTCTEEGLTLYECTKCGYTEERDMIEATGHTIVTHTKKATINSNGSYIEKCATCGEIIIENITPKIDEIIMEDDSFVYNGASVKPNITVYDGAGEMIGTSHYSVKYSNNDSIGMAQAVVTFKGNYSGTITLYYTITEATVMTGWQKLSNKWYYYNKAGVMLTGWQKISSKWYYFNKNGVMLTGWQKVSGKWYYLKKSGAMLTDWQKINGKWYYFNSSGAMQTGWIKLSGKWYYLNTDGSMRTADLKTSQKTYKFNSSGVCTNP